ncbi:MAG: Fic family protein, partial [Planctomycetota bacterium]
MGNQEIISLTDEKVPTIVSYSNEAQAHVIGDAARITGLKGKTTVFNFKPDLGKGDAEYSKEKKYWCYLAPRGEQKEIIETYTAKEAAMHFLKTLLKDVELPDQVLIGEPAIREQAWRENFRRHIREIFQEMDLGVTPKFFSEPFAVFQYYRNEFFPKTSKSEIVLVIDIGGGTFNTCIIKTTDEGYLSRGGGTNVPLGLQAEVCGGREIDKGLLEIVIKKARKQGIVWKEDPMYRAESGKSPVILHIEDAKIKLSDSIGTEARLAEDHSKVKVDVNFEKGMLHTESDINVELTGKDLKDVIRKIWRKKYGAIIIKTINEAKKQLSKLKFKLEKLDKVIVAGGSSRLPFTREEIHTVLPTRVKSEDIFVAPYLGKAVASGLAYESLEQIKKNPELSVGNIAPCLLNELYLGFRKSRRSPIITPKIRFGGSIIRNGQLISEPFVIEDFKLAYQLEMPFEAGNQVFYCFCDQPFQEDGENIPLNLSNDVFSLDTDKKIIKKWTLEIEIKKNGMIRPAFIFKEKGKGAQKEGKKVYVVQFMKPVDIDSEIEYPTFDVIPATLDKLRELEKEILEYKTGGLLSEENIIKYSLDQMLLLVFHSNKIEGNPLTKGETETVIDKNDPTGLSKGEREAYNLERTYKWMLENYNACVEEPEGFIRTLNRKILEETSRGGGEYRLKPVKISGMDFKPPISSAVPSFMEKLADELKEGASERSIIEFAATMHTKLVAIHPFIDGNGRTARLLMNAILLKYSLPPIIVNFADKQRYLT